MGTTTKSRFYEKILKLWELIRLENSFSFTRAKLKLFSEVV
ncbi:hypothetical protein LEP1GSC073_2036 [Leptospira noguchii str. Cascata]|nr:hypothetical protein LEP1GSC072_1880 [Leptospira noguchii str. Bonito]EMS90019.1 hypothetical protein LEP1GSC073_2036 [Leptospira noguchii str. Cascata]